MPKRCPKGTRRDSKTKECVKKVSPSKQNKKVSPSKQNKKVTKTITYEWDGGTTTRKLNFPGVNLSYISPLERDDVRAHGSEGIFDEDFSGFDFTGSDISYSNFTNCDFRKTNMKNVNMDNSQFQGSDFRGAYGLTAKQKKIIKRWGFLTERDVTIFKEQQKKITLLAKEFNKLQKKLRNAELRASDKIFNITSRNWAHGSSSAVRNKYKVYSCF